VALVFLHMSYITVLQGNWGNTTEEDFDSDQKSIWRYHTSDFPQLFQKHKQAECEMMISPKQMILLFKPVFHESAKASINESELMHSCVW